MAHVLDVLRSQVHSLRVRWFYWSNRAIWVRLPRFVTKWAMRVLGRCPLCYAEGTWWRSSHPAGRMQSCPRCWGEGTWTLSTLRRP